MHGAWACKLQCTCRGCPELGLRCDATVGVAFTDHSLLLSVRFFHH
jgi:hypothetical protein